MAINANEPEETHIDLPSQFQGKRIPIEMQDRLRRPADRSLVTFQRMDRDAGGPYSFWTVMQGNTPLFSVRTRPGRTAEDRLLEFLSMDADSVLRLHLVADRIVPATDVEILNWLLGHPGDLANLASEERAHWFPFSDTGFTRRP